MSKKAQIEKTISELRWQHDATLQLHSIRESPLLYHCGCKSKAIQQKITVLKALRGDSSMHFGNSSNEVMQAIENSLSSLYFNLNKSLERERVQKKGRINNRLLKLSKIQPVLFQELLEKVD